MNRRDLIGASLAAIGGVFMGRRWYQQGRGLVVPDSGLVLRGHPRWVDVYYRAVWGGGGTSRIEVSSDGGRTWHNATQVPFAVQLQPGLYTTTLESVEG